jgi:hypothetical protein
MRKVRMFKEAEEERERTKALKAELSANFQLTSTAMDLFTFDDNFFPSSVAAAFALLLII